MIRIILLAAGTLCVTSSCIKLDAGKSFYTRTGNSEIHRNAHRLLKTKANSDLSAPDKKDIAMQLVSSAENSSLQWREQYKYIEDIKDGRGYTGGIIGFTSATGDLLDVVLKYQQLAPGNVLEQYIPALRTLARQQSESHKGLDPTFAADWRKAAADPLFEVSQDAVRDAQYFDPAVTLAKQDGLRALGQFIYYDAAVVHGLGDSASSLQGIRLDALKKAKPPAKGGDEATYLEAFLDARLPVMKEEAAHTDVSRIETAQRKFLREKNFDLNTPLEWSVYNQPFKIN